MRKRKKIKLLFVDILTDNLLIKKKAEKEVTGGPYAELFRRNLGLKKNELLVVDASGEKLPDSRRHDGIIIGGSLENPVAGEEKPWMKKVYTFIRKAVNQKIPLLGVCGGHQFVARALGQKVIYNPKGRELGTVRLTLTKDGQEDILFKDVPKNFFVQASHQCVVKSINRKWKLLAFSNLCRVQAVAVNNLTRIIQFHPEFSAKNVKAIVRLREGILAKEGFVSQKGFKKFLSSIKETKYPVKILRNFLKFFVLPNTRG